MMLAAIIAFSFPLTERESEREWTTHEPHAHGRLRTEFVMVERGPKYLSNGDIMTK